MRRWLKSAAALLLCAAAVVLLIRPASAEMVWFMAVNDTPLELSAADMPMVVGRVLYVPYFMLSANTTGVNLGVYAVYNPSQGRVLVYSNRKQLVFDLQANQTYDLEGTSYPERAMRRNSTVYIPIARVCEVFREIWYSSSSTPYGQLVRVKNASVVLGDEAFIAAASSRMSRELDRYLQSQPTPQPTPSESPPPTGSGAAVYLAFTFDGEGEEWESGLEQTLEALARQDCQALFFLTADEMAAHDDLVRRLVGLGHLVGARLTADAGPEALSQLDKARACMAEAARCRMAAALAAQLGGEELEPVARAAGVCWQTTIDGRELSGAGANRTAVLLRRLTPGETARNYLLLDTGAGDTLESVLAALKEADFNFRPPVPTELTAIS